MMRNGFAGEGSGTEHIRTEDLLAIANSRRIGAEGWCCVPLDRCPSRSSTFGDRAYPDGGLASNREFSKDGAVSPLDRGGIDLSADYADFRRGMDRAPSMILSIATKCLFTVMKS